MRIYAVFEACVMMLYASVVYVRVLEKIGKKLCMWIFFFGSKRNYVCGFFFFGLERNYVCGFFSSGRKEIMYVDFFSSGWKEIMYVDFFL